MKPFLIAGRLIVLLLLLTQTRWLAAGNRTGAGAPKRFLGENSKGATAVGAIKHKIGDKNQLEEEEDKETIAQRLDEALKHEFHEEEDKKVDEGKIYNETAKTGEATTETVLLISQKKSGNHTEGDSKTVVSSPNTEHTGSDAAAKDDSALDLVVEADVDRIIDSHDNEYVLSKPNEEGSMGLNLDPQFVRDLTIVIAASAVAGFLMEALGQPTINGYFIAGSLVGPGGLKLIKELVQVQSMAQLGVQLLLFSLGLEFSLSRLKSMQNVAILGGLLQIALVSTLSSIGALFIGALPSQGAFLGALVSMSSTSIVVKCLNDAKVQNQLPGQITIAILVLQDCVVGLLFALMPVLSSTADGSGVSAVVVARVLGRVGLMLGVTVGAAVLIAFTVLPLFTRLLARHTSAETYQLLAISFCLLTSLATAKMGVSSELGAFVAGVMLGATDQQERMLHHLEPITHFFVALFIASIGLILSPVFLFNHIAVLAAGVVVVIIAKIVLFGGVVWLFRYPAATSFAVGVNLAQIGEFGFVLLSVAHQYELVPSQVYMLLMGVTALSLLVTPFLMQLSLRLVPGARQLQQGGSRMEMTALKKQLSGGVGGGEKGLPPSPSGSGSGDVLLRLSSVTGQELGHREEEPYSPMEASKGLKGAQGYTRGVPHGKGPLPGEAGYGGTPRHHSAPAKGSAPAEESRAEQQGKEQAWW